MSAHNMLPKRYLFAALLAADYHHKNHAYAGLDACQFSRHRFFRTAANKGICIPANCMRQESAHCTNRIRKSIQSKLIDHVSAFVDLSTAASRQPVVLKDIA